MSKDRHDSVFACKCLNVRIHPRKPPGDSASSSSSDSDFKPVYVGDDGLTIAHPQVTLRTRSKGVPIPETSRCTRSVTLSCLICQTLVYRVHQNIPIDIEGKDGPMLPTDDWAEQECLMSASGWIDLHINCLTGEAISNAENSPSYSSIFSVVLPTISSPSSETAADPLYVPSTSPPISQSPQSHLPAMRPIFPPAPFTPSHPVFVHLSSVVANRSETLRTDAEAHIAEIVKQKVAEIENAEAELRRQVEAVWKGFRSGVDAVEKENGGRLSHRRKDSSNWQQGNQPGTYKPSPAPVSVRDFNPVPSPRRVASPTSGRRVSSLSASLATSSFHHPRAQAEQIQDAHSTTERNSHSPPPYSSHPSSLSSKSYSSLSSRSSRSDPIQLGSVKSNPKRTEEGALTVLEPFRRHMDQDNDTATSFRYFTILEADAARTREKAGKTLEDASQERVATISNGPESRLDETKLGSSEIKTRKSRARSDGAKTQKEIPGNSEPAGQNDVTKGKRKVTFDVKPDVVTITREVDAEKAEEETERASRAVEEMIFDLEDEGDERSNVSATESILPLNEPLHMPTRPPRTRNAGAGLPSSLSTLRPASLPAPSSVRPSRVIESQDNSPSNSQPQGLLSPNAKHPTENSSDSDDSSGAMDIRDLEILKLVAANTPSHRGAWKKDSKAWQTFAHRKSGERRSNGGLIPEEEEDSGEDQSADSNEDSNPNFNIAVDISSSLPIAIGPLAKPREVLSLASYQPKTSLSDRPGVLVPPLPSRQSYSSSAANRKAAYAERDLSRSMDPGALDFGAGEEDDDEDDESSLASLDHGERGRQRALRILQVRSEVPASGMWRSLA